MSRGPRVPSELEATPRGEKKRGPSLLPYHALMRSSPAAGLKRGWGGGRFAACLHARSMPTRRTDGWTDGQNETGTAQDDELQTYLGRSRRRRRPNSPRGAASALLSARISSLPPVSSPPCDRLSLFSSPYICTYK